MFDKIKKFKVLYFMYKMIESHLIINVIFFFQG